MIAKVAGIVAIAATVAFVVTGNPVFFAIASIAGAAGTAAGAHGMLTLKKPAVASP